MILLADDSHEISFFISFQNLERSCNLSSAAVVIGTLTSFCFDGVLKNFTFNCTTKLDDFTAFYELCRGDSF